MIDILKLLVEERAVDSVAEGRRLLNKKEVTQNGVILSYGDIPSLDSKIEFGKCGEITPKRMERYAKLSPFS